MHIQSLHTTPAIAPRQPTRMSFTFAEIKLKTQIQTLLVFFILSTGALLQAKDPTQNDFPASFGSLGEFQQQVKKDLISSDWDALYEKLSPAYRRNITKELFLKEIEEEKILVEDIKFQRTQSFEKAGYSIYGCAATYKGTEKVFFDAAFYSRDESGVWFLETFSFSQNPTIKYGGTIPEGLRNGIRKTN